MSTKELAYSIFETLIEKQLEGVILLFTACTFDIKLKKTLEKLK